MKLSGKTYLQSIFLLLALSSSMDAISQVSEKTVIKGFVFDAKTGVPLTGANVFLEKSTVGTITDNEGKYSIETSVPTNKIVFSFIGYQTESRNISKGITQTLNISLKLSSITLDEVIVNPGKSKYRNKNNPAVDLIEKVIYNKRVNRKENFDYLEYKKYEKIQFALSNITEKLKQGSLFGKFRFVFDNLDTTKRIGNIFS